MIDWTEKYRPKDLTQIIGNNSIVTQLYNWAKTWEKNKPSKKAVILSGKPGIGKTSCAYALAKQLNWIPIELNTSDARNRERIQKVATAGSHHQSFSDEGCYISTESGGRKLIILDEADNLYERSYGGTSGTSQGDKGGKKAIVDTVLTTKQPIILIVNDYYKLIKGSGKSLEKTCIHLSFKQPLEKQISLLIQRICQNEDITIDSSVLHYLSTQCNGDIRSAIRDLQSLSIGKNHLTEDLIDTLGFRDQTEIIFNVLSTIFRTNDIPKIRHDIRHIDLDPQMLLFWITENTPRLYRKSSDMVLAYHHVSLADIYLSRTMKRSNYRMWAYASDHMSIGVSLSKTTRPMMTRFQYPNWLRQRKKKETVNELELIKYLAKLHHCSQKKSKQELFPLIKKISKNIKIDISEIQEHLEINKESFYFSKKTTDTKEHLLESTRKEKENDLKDHRKQKKLFN